MINALKDYSNITEDIDLVERIFGNIYVVDDEPIQEIFKTRHGILKIIKGIVNKIIVPGFYLEKSAYETLCGINLNSNNFPAGVKVQPLTPIVSPTQFRVFNFKIIVQFSVNVTNEEFMKRVNNTAELYNGLYNTAKMIVLPQPIKHVALLKANTGECIEVDDCGFVAKEDVIPTSTASTPRNLFQ